MDPLLKSRRLVIDFWELTLWRVSRRFLTVDGATLHFKGSQARYGVAVALRPVTPDDNYLEV